MGIETPDCVRITAFAGETGQELISGLNSGVIFDDLVFACREVPVVQVSVLWIHRKTYNTEVVSNDTD